jgi:glyceraldehyde-3-phosphate dehydrogenase/erythrose-4-phosphate dehydrogenase
MSKTSLKNIQKQKKKARRTIARSKVTRVQGNTPAVRKRLKKLAGKVRGAAKKAG